MKITRLDSSKDNFLMKSFPSSTKRELSILLNFLFLFNSVFLTLKCRTLGLIPPHGDRMVAILLKMDILHLKVGVLNASYTFQPLMSFWYSWYYYIHFEITGDPCNLFGSQLSFCLIHVLNCFISVLNRNIFALYQVISMSKTKWVLKAFLFSTFQQTRIFHSLNDIRLECVKLKRSGTVSHPEKF